MNTLIENIEKLHTTELGKLRISRNLSLEHPEQAVDFCTNLIKKASEFSQIKRLGKNYYAETDGIIITINAHSYTIITAKLMPLSHKKNRVI